MNVLGKAMRGMVVYGVIFTLCCVAQGFSQTRDVTVSLGLPVTMTDIYIRGEQVEPIPRKDRSSSLVIRILKVKPADQGYRYDLEVYGLDPGTYSLADYLRYARDQSAISNLDTKIQITTAHDAEGVPKPEELAHTPPENLGGYRRLLIAVACIWLVVFLIILFYRKKKPVEEDDAVPVPTLHEKLQVLVASAARGDLSDGDRSQLERLVLGHWKQHLPEIEALPPAQALSALREDPAASPLLLKLEDWLHAPNPSVSQKDITHLLEPFKHEQPSGVGEISLK